MTPIKKIITRAMLDALYFSGGFHLLEKNWGGVGIIFTLHRVVPETQESFSPNRILEITPEFLDATILQVKKAGYEIISLDELGNRMQRKQFDRKFAVFTLDDGYVDNYTDAWPIFKKHQIPFAIYLATGFPEGQVVLWWTILEQIILDNDQVSVEVAGEQFELPTQTTAEKYKAFDQIYWSLRKQSHQVLYAEFAKIMDAYHFDWQALCRQVSLTWSMIHEMNQDPLVTIGAHTVHHYALSRLDEAQMRTEITESCDAIEQQLKEAPQHFTYPYGDTGSAAAREFSTAQALGFKTSTTTRKGLLFPEHSDHLQALPRVSLNGDYQLSRYVRLFLSGAPFALWNRFKRLDIH